jgi:hypothetical protein
VLIGVSLTLLIALTGIGVFVFMPRTGSHAAAAINLNCTLVVPDAPLTAQGLATPYQLMATNAADGPCNEANAAQSAFVQGVIYDTATGQFSVYNPLIIDAGTTPLVMPAAPTLPVTAAVSLWFGFNGTNLTLQGAQAATLQAAGCVNGVFNSIFGQFADCSSVAFFQKVQQGLANGLVKPPALGMANDGKPCPTTRDFSLIDQDQSDNVTTKYLANANGQIAQFSAANQALFPNAVAVTNPSDNGLLDGFVDPSLGCQPWMAPNLVDNNVPVPALPLNEIQAAMYQQAPIAFVPMTDPMVLNNANTDLAKTNAYRAGVDQIAAATAADANGTTYCSNFLSTGIPRIQADTAFTANFASPNPAVANTLFTLLANRAMLSYINLNCPNLLNVPNPVTVQTTNGVVTGATITLPQATVMQQAIAAGQAAQKSTNPANSIPAKQVPVKGKE